MALSADKIMADLKAAAKPELEKRAIELQKSFLANVKDFLDDSKIHVLEELLAKAAQYEIDAIMSDDAETARQYAEAAEDVLRQVSVRLIAEKVVAAKATAAMIEAAALSIWTGFKSAATGLLGAAIKGAIAGLIPGGGAIADAAGTFLEDIIVGDDPDTA